MSHPAWVRGLKHGKVRKYRKKTLVAPRVGAWIETAEPIQSMKLSKRRTPRGCVD